MVKRKRNAIGRFISSASTHIGSASGLIHENFYQKIITLFMTLLFAFIISPWLTLAVKSKKMKNFIFSLLQIYSKHFISEDKFNEGFCNTKKMIFK